MATLKFEFNSLLTPVTIYQRHVFVAKQSRLDIFPIFEESCCQLIFYMVTAVSIQFLCVTNRMRLIVTDCDCIIETETQK